jgi:hypothetical protein
MLRKLLTLAICFLVLAPQQFCTCGAGESVCTDTSCPLAVTCDHHHDADGLIDADDDHDQSEEPTHKHRDPHHPDCPAVSVEMRWTAPRSTSADLPLVVTGVVATRIDDFPSPCVPRPELPSVLGPPHVPLFLSLLVLRN